MKRWHRSILLAFGLGLAGCGGKTTGWQPGTFESKLVTFKIVWRVTGDLDLHVKTSSGQNCGWGGCWFGHFSGDDTGPSDGEHTESAQIQTVKGDEPYTMTVENKSTSDIDVDVAISSDGVTNLLAKTVTIPASGSVDVATYQLQQAH